MGKLLRASVIRKSEWFKDRNENEWKPIRLQALRRDQYACVYCGWKAQRFQQVNHIGAEDNHHLDNLETVCKACHTVLHMGINAMDGILSAFDCKPELTDMVTIVKRTRVLVARNTPWADIHQQILEQYALPGGRVYTCDQTTVLAQKMLNTIPPDEYRGYLPEGKAILFHASEPWKGFSERVRIWQLPD